MVGILGTLALIGGVSIVVSPRAFAVVNKFAFSIEKVSEHDK